MTSPPDKPAEVMPRGVLLTIVGVIGVTALYGFAQRTIDYGVPKIDVPIVGEWRAEGKSWRMAFYADKSLEMNADSAQTASNETSGAQASLSGPGKYWLGLNGKVAIKLRNGKVLNAVWKPISPNRFDLIDVDTEGVTTFDRVSEAAPK
ncbi:hypothetical protein [Methylocapsa aurea]|uniref:hypothetical protein n=1 Tax=Methylocapsa aurea TaxID=663610 RepID=UPI00056D31EF|nr:hypothetical protein [Methylocapsa aurea]